MCISVTPPPSEAYILSESYLPLDQLLCIDDLLICYKSNLRSELRKILGFEFFLFFFYFFTNMYVVVLKRIASPRQFFWVLTTYILIEIW